MLSRKFSAICRVTRVSQVGINGVDDKDCKEQKKRTHQRGYKYLAFIG
jgi:hypothetical protein